MCFSAAASFTAATATGIAGVVTATRVTTFREAPLGSVPLIFAVQQAIEGGLWLVLGHQWPEALGPMLANSFVTIALVVWPLLAPVAILLVEMNSWRRAAIAALLLMGAVVAVYSASDIVQHPYAAQAIGGSLCYVNKSPFPLSLFAAYALATCGPALISSRPVLRGFGVIVVTGGIVSLFFYFVAFLSVWCFFAAAASVVIGAHFVRGTRDVPVPVSF